MEAEALSRGGLPLFFKKFFLIQKKTVTPSRSYEEVRAKKKAPEPRFVRIGGLWAD